MRGAAIAITLLLALPLTGSLGAPAPAPTPAVPTGIYSDSPAARGLLPADLPDADLLILLAREIGLHAARPATPLATPPGVTLPGMVHHLAARAGAADRLAPEDLLPFARLDPRVAAPATLLLVAVDRAWDQRDHAFRDVPPDDLRALARALRDAPDDPATRALEADVLARVDKAALVDAAILLLDTLEAHVLPALHAAVDAGAWPPQGAWDPAGVLRLGSLGDDLETMDRIVQIDPRGNDEYRNNAGGTTVLDDLSAATMDTAVAVSVDFSGGDAYASRASFSQGGAFTGIGLLLDSGGGDAYSCIAFCQGAGSPGIGVFRDLAGDDVYTASDHCMGYGTLLGTFREDGGNERYAPASLCAGASNSAGGAGLLWDRHGQDRYESPYGSPFLYAWGEAGGNGLLVDEGDETDYYATANPKEVTSEIHLHGCNDCTWEAGLAPGSGAEKTGRGSDNHGGLLSVFERNPTPRAT